LEQDIKENRTTEEEGQHGCLEKGFNILHHGLDYTGILGFGNQ
jgi:hypothetical protein